MADNRGSTTKSPGNQARPDRPANPGASAVRQVAGEASAFAQELSEKTKATADATTHALEQTHAIAVKGTADFHRQWLEMIRVNTSSTLEFMQQLAGAKSPTEFFELSAAHYRTQLETFAEQTQHLMALGQKVATDSVAPVQSGIQSALTKAA